MKNKKKKGIDKKRLVDVIFISLIVLVIAVFICVIAKNNCSSCSTPSSSPKGSHYVPPDESDESNPNFIAPEHSSASTNW